MGQVNAGGQPVGMVAGAAIIFFAYIGFDSVSTHAEEAKNPTPRCSDRHHRLTACCARCCTSQLLPC